MNDAQLDFTRTWNGPHDQRYFDGLRAIGESLEPAVDGVVQEAQTTQRRIVPADQQLKNLHAVSSSLLLVRMPVYSGKRRIL